MRTLNEHLPAVTATDELLIQLPEGAIIKHISAQNATRDWNKISILLSRNKKWVAGEGVPLLHEAIQAGSRHVAWRGEINVTGPYSFVIAQFFHCTAADDLDLNVGYEMPPLKRGWP